MSSTDGTYRTKRITYYGNELPILMQNENGPCPLLALANVLLLRGANHNAPNLYGDMPLHRAVQNGREASARMLLDSGATYTFGGTPIVVSGAGVVVRITTTGNATRTRTLLPPCAAAPRCHEAP